MTLEVLYQTVFATIVRVQSGTQTAATADDLKTTLRSQLKEVDQVLHLGVGKHTSEQLEAAKFAVVAFADEVALRSSQPAIKDHWVSNIQKSLSHGLFDETKSGESFYRRLAKLRSFGSRSEELIDVLEIYCICLLLGFEGGHTAVDRGSLINELVRDIQQLRQITPVLAFGDANLQQTVSPVSRHRYLWMYRTAFGLLVLVVLVYMAAQWNLRAWSNNAVEQMSNRSLSAPERN